MKEFIVKHSAIVIIEYNILYDTHTRLTQNSYTVAFVSNGFIKKIICT